MWTCLKRLNARARQRAASLAAAGAEPATDGTEAPLELVGPAMPAQRAAATSTTSAAKKVAVAI